MVSRPETLPADLFHLVAEQVSASDDFSTLHNLVVSSKLLATSGAISALYRISHESPVKGGGSEGVSLAEQGLNVQKWSILWRTVIMSALGNTLYPYCRHLRMLDLHDLGELLEDDKFRDRISKHFFSGNLARFKFVLSTSTRGRAAGLDIKKIVRAVGDEIVPRAPLLDALSEPARFDIFSSALLDWAPKLQHLRWLDLFNGQALADETLRLLLHSHCPHLEILKVYHVTSPDADHTLASFISGMRENQLKHFENHSNCGISSETCLALNRHGSSLATLKMDLSEEGVLALGLLQGCTALRTLSVSCDRTVFDLKMTQNDSFLEIVEWLKNSTSLKDVTFVNILSAPDLITPLLLNPEVELESLEITAKFDEAMYLVKDHHAFHKALSRQQSLRLLHLVADADPMTRDDLEILMETLTSLKHLEELKLFRISDYFTDQHINLLAECLPQLEELSIGGYGISDAVWNGIATLQGLRVLSFIGITRFTTEGIMRFIDRLGAGNQGIALSVDYAEYENMISVEDQDLLRDLIAAKADGRFEYQLMRDPTAPDFDSDDSD